MLKMSKLLLFDNNPILVFILSESFLSESEDISLKGPKVVILSHLNPVSLIIFFVLYKKNSFGIS